MAFGSQRLHAIGAPIVFLLFSLMALGSAAPLFDNWHLPDWHLPERLNPLLHPPRLPFQGRGQLQVLAEGPHGFQPAGYLSSEGQWVDGFVPLEIGVFDGRRRRWEDTVVLQTSQKVQCGLTELPILPVIRCGEGLGPNPPPVGPIVGDRIEATWAAFTPSQGKVMSAIRHHRLKVMISFMRIEPYNHAVQLKWVPL
ncbi:MAG: hypothetical protein M1826_001644 [Phylliscum demangeonii]|nr:MAG: hypothetical protein M1826_001644 [Phylliscum demangeonii]